jgi:hypothetical protein
MDLLISELDFSIANTQSVVNLLSCFTNILQKLGQHRQEHNIKKANRYFEDVSKLKYLGTTLTDQNCMQEDYEQTTFGECTG